MDPQTNPTPQETLSVATLPPLNMPPPGEVHLANEETAAPRGTEPSTPSPQPPAAPAAVPAQNPTPVKQDILLTAPLAAKQMVQHEHHRERHPQKTSHPHGPHEKQRLKPQPLIQLDMVSKTYGDDPLDFKTLVLKNVYLQIFEGEFLVIFGPSGSGKSTILNILAGLEMPTAGRILLRRKDLSQYSSEELARYHRQKMGMVFQSFNLIKSLNVWENVALPQTASGIGYRKRKARAIKLLQMLNIEHYANRHPNEISGGEQQRVAIARALVNDPMFLLVDEPTGNLDSKSAEEVMTILYNLNVQSKHTIVLVTHNPNQLHYATRVVYVEDGKIVIEEKRDRPDLSASNGKDVVQRKKIVEYKGDA